MTLILWIILAISLFLIGFFLEVSENGWGVTITILCTIVIFRWLVGPTFITQSWEWVLNNWAFAIIYLVVYITVGLIWSLIKWFMYLRKMKREGYTKESRILQVSENKGTIILWMSYWPISLIATLLNDPLRKLITEIFDYFSGTYQKILDSVFKD